MGAGNHTLEFKLITGNSKDDVEIHQLNNYFYDNIILMAPTVKAFGADLKVKELLEYVDSGHNLMMFSSSDSRKTPRLLANEFGIDYEDYGYIMQGGTPPTNSEQKAFKPLDVSWSKEVFQPLHKDH